MKRRLQGSNTFTIILALTIVGFIVWNGGLLVVWLILRQLGFTTSLWTMIGALSTAVAAVGVGAAGYVAYKELSEISSGRRIDVADKLFIELNSPENIDARRWVYLMLDRPPQEGLDAMTDEEQARMKRVLNSLDRVAFLTQGNWIPDEIIMPWMHPMIAKSWEKLEPYVLHERKRRNEPDYYRYAGELAQRCIAWRTKNHLGNKVTWVQDAL